MAKTVKAEAKDATGPDFFRAAKNYEKLDALGEQAASVRGKQAAEWKEIEGKGIHKGAGKVIDRVRSMSVEQRADFMRTFKAGVEFYKLDDFPDLLDPVEDKEPKKPAGKKGAGVDVKELAGTLQ